MYIFFWATVVCASLVFSLTAVFHALIMKRDPRSALGWIVVSITIPFLGPLLYWIMGINRISRKAKRWQEKGRSIGGRNVFQLIRRDYVPPSLPGFAFHLRELRNLSDRIVSSVFTAGNRITPLYNGDEAYPEMLHAIAGARSSIHLSTYIFDVDHTGLLFVEALNQAASRGVEVRVLVDGLGEKYSFPTARSLFKGSKVEFSRFLPLRQGGYLNLRNHRKTLVVDGLTGFSGGMNIGGRHMIKVPEVNFPVADVHFKFEGPVVGDLQQVFLEDWYFATRRLMDEKRYFPPLTEKGFSLARVIADGPEKGFRNLHWIIMGALSCARKRVGIMTPYFIPDRAMISSMATTAMRGIEVTLVLPAINNLPLVHWATRSYLWELLQCGIRVFYQPPPFAHTKLFLVDGVWSLLGSANIDPRSLRLNFELNMEVYDRKFTETMDVVFMKAVNRSKEVSLDDMDNRPFHEKLRDGVAKLFSPYL